MGSALVKANLGAGRYQVELVKSEAKALARKTAIEARQIVVDQMIIVKETELATAQAALAAKITAFSDAVAEMNAGTKTVGDVQKAQNEAAAAEATVIIKRREVGLYKFEKFSLAKELTQIETVLTKETVHVWCADYSQKLTGMVGTIEINGESEQILIMPVGAAGIGILQEALAGTPAGVFYNWALLPCWQKWKPTYRVGKILAITPSTNKCDVGIAAQYSEGLLINQAGDVYNATEAAIDGWTAFAVRNGSFPLVTNTADTTIPMTTALSTDLTSVNNSVNTLCKYQPDLAQYGKAEYWTIMQDGASGDCEDFAITKAKKLLDLGYPASAIHIEVGVTEAGISHAWLVIQTDGGDYALDNRYISVVKNTSTPYSNRKRQTGMNWKRQGVKLSNVPIEYMSSDAAVFAVDDEVIVQFLGQNWASPKVIGFSSNPKPDIPDCFIYVHDLRVNKDIMRVIKLSSDGLTVTETTMDVSGYLRDDGWTKIAGLTVHPTEKHHFLWVVAAFGSTWTLEAIERDDNTNGVIATHRVHEASTSSEVKIDGYLMSTVAAGEFLMAAEISVSNLRTVYVVDGNFHVLNTMSNYGYGFDMIDPSEYYVGGDPYIFRVRYGRAERIKPRNYWGDDGYYTKINGVKNIRSLGKFLYGIHSYKFGDAGQKLWVSEVRLANEKFTSGEHDYEDNLDNYITLWTGGPFGIKIYSFQLIDYIEGFRGFAFVVSAVYNDPYNFCRIVMFDENGSLLRTIELAKPIIDNEMWPQYVYPGKRWIK